MGKRMDESVQRKAIQRQQRPILPPTEPVEDAKSDEPTPEPVRNCATCRLYPCKLWQQRPDAFVLQGDMPYTFKVLAQIPMPCGGYYWEQRERSDWEKRREQVPSGMAQFIKKKGSDS